MDTAMLSNIFLYALLGWFVYSRFGPIKGLKICKEDKFASELAKHPKKILIDVREPNEFKTGYLSGATNIPLSQLKNRMGQISKDKNIFLYCRSGMRSKQAAKILSKNGYQNLSHLQGGMMSWRGKISK